MSAARSGQVITFYSYKGGTGRSMALANVACLLVQRQSGRRVLAVDWDLEAPGLHRYFQAALGGLSSPEADERIKLAPGLLDLLWAARERFGVPPVSLEEQPAEPPVPAPDPVQALEDMDLERYLLPIDVPNAQSSNLWLLKAGC